MSSSDSPGVLRLGYATPTMDYSPPGKSFSQQAPTPTILTVPQVGVTPSSSTETSSGSGSDLTTLELHPNVILGLNEEEEQGRPHFCNICRARYKTRTHLRRHMFIHMKARPFSCPDCGKGFNRREHLNKHLEAVHTGNKHNCPYCNKEISRMDHLKRHIKNMHTNRPKLNEKGTMLKVQMTYGTEKQKTQISFLAPHFPSATGTILTPIPLANTSSTEDMNALESKSNLELSRTTPLNSSLNSLSRSETDATPPSMTITPSNILGPGQGVATLSVQNTPTQKVLVHQRLAPGYELDVAAATANGFSGLSSLNFNLLCEEQPKSDREGKRTLLQIFPCEQCPATFTSEKELSIHIKSHKGKPQSHQCPECPRAYTRREKLTEHIRCVHQGQKFDCEHCGKKLSRKDHVIRHIRSVHPEVYAASFIESDDGYITLDEHGKLVSSRNLIPLVSPSRKRKKHLSCDPLSIPSIGDVGVLLRSVCQQCYKVFGTAYHLTRHIESCHNGDARPFICGACNKMFKRKDHLTKHIKSHCPTIKEITSSIRVSTPPNEKEEGPSCDMPPPSVSSSSDRKVEVGQQLIKNGKGKLETNVRTVSEAPSSSSDDSIHPHHTVLQNLQLELGSSGTANGVANSSISQPESIAGPAIIMEGSGHKHSEHHSEFSLAVIDSFMQGNVNVVVVDEDISHFLQQSSSSHVTTTFPCGHCQKEFHARDQLIAHLQDHNTVSVLPNGQHISDISFADF